MAKRTAKDIDAEIAKIGTLDMGSGGGTNLRTIARDDGWGAYAKDALYHLGRGTSGLVRGAAAIGDEAANGLSRRFTGKDAGPGFSKIANPLMNGFEKGISGLRSATDQLDEEDMQEAIQASKDRGEDWTGQTAAALRSTGLRGASLMAIEQVPGLAPGVGIQKLVRGGMALAGKGATKAGVNLSAKNAARAKTLSGMGEAAIGNAAQSYLSNAGEVVQDNLENGRQWDKGLDELKKGLYVSAGIGALEHKLGVRAESAIVNRMGSKMSGGAGAAVNSAPVPKGGLAKRAFGTVKNGVKGAVGGAASEGYTSYSEQKDINRALGRDENDDLGMAVYQGILGGAAFGGGTKMLGQDRPYHQRNVPITPNTTHDLLGGNPPPSGGSGPGKAVATANNVLDSIDRAAGDTDGETSAAVKVVREAANANPAVAEAAAKCRSAEDVRSLAEQIKDAARQPQPKPQAPTAEGQGQALPAGNPAPQQNMPGANRPQVAPQPGDAQQAVAQSAPPQAKEINSLNELDQMGFDEISTLAGGIQDKDGSAVKAFSQLDDGQKLTLKAVAAGASAAGKKISGADLVAQASKYKSPQEHLDALNKRINDIATTSVPGGKSDSSALASAIAERAVLTGKCEANPLAIQSYLYGKDGVMHMAQSIQESIVNAQNLRARAEKAVQKAATKLQDAKIKLNAAKISKNEKKIAAAQAEFAQAEAELAAAKGAAEENRAAVAEGQNKLTEFLARISGETQAPKPQEAAPAEPRKAIPATAEGPTEQPQAAPAEQKAETPAEPTQAIPATPEPEAPAEQTPKAPAEPEAEADTGTQPRALPIAEGRAILMEPERASDNAENDAYEAKHESSNYVPPSQKAARAKWESDKSNAARRTAAEDDANASNNSLEAKQDSLSPYNQSVVAAKKKRAAGKKQNAEDTARHKQKKAKAETHRQNKKANDAKRTAALSGLRGVLKGVEEQGHKRTYTQEKWKIDKRNAAERAADEKAANAANDALDARQDSSNYVANKQAKAREKWDADVRAARPRAIIAAWLESVGDNADKMRSAVNRTRYAYENAKKQLDEAVSLRKSRLRPDNDKAAGAIVNVLDTIFGGEPPKILIKQVRKDLVAEFNGDKAASARIDDVVRDIRNGLETYISIHNGVGINGEATRPERSGVSSTYGVANAPGGVVTVGRKPSNTKAAPRKVAETHKVANAPGKSATVADKAANDRMPPEGVSESYGVANAPDKSVTVGAKAANARGTSEKVSTTHKVANASGKSVAVAVRAANDRATHSTVSRDRASANNKEYKNETSKRPEKAGGKERNEGANNAKQEQHPAKQVQPVDAGERAARNPQPGERSAGGAKRNPVEPHEPGNRADGAGSVPDAKASGRNREETPRKGKVVKANRNPSAYTRAVNASKEGNVEATRRAVDEYFANLPEGKKPATQMVRLRENLKSMGDDLFREAANDKPEGPDDPPPNGGKNPEMLLLPPKNELRSSRGLSAQARARVATTKAKTANVPKKAEGAAAPKGQKSVSSGEGRSTAESVRSELNSDPASKGVAKLVDNGTLNIVDREADLPDTVEKDGRTGGYYDPSTSKAYLVAENIAPGDARGVLLHEVGNHMVHDESMAPLDKRACLLVEDGVKRGDPLMQRVADRLKAAGETISSNPQETRAYLTEEAAKMVKPPRGVLGFFRQMKAAVNAWMTKHVGNVPGFRLSPEDMVRIAEAGVQKAAEGKRNISGQIQFSKAMTVTPEMRSVKEVADDGLAKKVLSGKEDWAYALERGLNDRARRTINAMPISDKAKFAVSKIADMIGKGMKTGLNAVFTRDLVQMAREFMPSAQRWYDTQIAKQNIKNSMMESAKYVQECFYQGVHSHEEREAAYRFMADVTYNQVWWTSKRPNWVDEHQWMRYVSLSSEPYTKADGTEGKRFTEEKRKAFEKAKAAWESMSDTQQKAVEEYFKWTYSAKRKEIEALEQLNRDTTHKLLEQIDMKIREAGGALARTSGEKEIKKAEARMKKLRAERAALANRFKDIPKMIESEVSVLAAPYAPLRRLGDHLIIGKSKEYLGLENKLKSLEQRHKDSPESYTNEDAAEAKSIREQLEEMKGDGKHYWLDSEDGAFSSRNKMDALQKANPNLVFSEPFPVSEASDRGVIRINQLKNVIDQAAIDMDDLGVDGDTKDYIMGLSKAANELMVKSMLNSAIQKSQLKRNNVMGFDTNMMRVFDEYSIRQANHVATLCTERAQRSAMSSMIKEKKTAPEERREYCTDLYNQIQRRTELLAKQDPQHWANKVQRFNAGMMLFTNPGYYFQNATQPFMMSASYMAGNFGMTKMTTEIGQVYGQLVKNFSGYFGKPWKLDDLVKDGVCNQEELAMLKQLNYENLLEASMKSEYGELNDSENWMARKYKLVSDKFVAVNQRVEMMNRISTALVAYRNAKGSDKVRGMRDAYKNSIVSKQFKGDMDAYAYAAEVVYRTHGDYSSLNSPAMMLQGGIHAGGLEKLLFQFRKYQLIQIGSYAHMLKKAFNGATPEERALGKREFLYTMGTNLAMCGLKGSFLLAQLMFLGNWAFGDDDETDEEWTKRMLGNGTAADILVGGLPEFAGLPVSSYIGAGEALSPFGFFRRHDGPGGVGFVEDLAFAAGGPTLSQADKMVRGFGNMWDATNIVTDYELDPYFKAGQFTKGLETVLPKGFGNAVKAVDQMVNGISSSTGNTQYLSPDEITYWDTFCTAMGIPSSHVSEAYETTGRNYEKLNLLKDKTSEVKGFIKSGDYEAAKRAIIRRNNLALKLNKKPKYYADYVKEIRAAEKRKASM